MTVLRDAAKFLFAAIDQFLPTPEGPRILIYHQVGLGRGLQMEVEREDFEWQLDWLLANREIVGLETAIRRWNEPGSERLVVLTFDDGYRDTFTTAFPLLKQRAIPFVLYIATGMIDAPARPTDAPPSLGWGEIEAMMDGGLVTVGAHTHTHRDLRRAEQDEIWWELETADSGLAQRLGIRVRHFAYPWGYWSRAAHEVVAVRYETAVLGSPRSRSDFDAHRIHRYPVQLSDGSRFFEARLEGGLLIEERLRRRIRGYRPESSV